MIRILFLSLLLPSVAFADNQDRARACLAACAAIADEAKRVECVRRCPPLGLASTGLEADALDDKPKKPAPAPKPAPPAPSSPCKAPCWEEQETRNGFICRPTMAEGCEYRSAFLESNAVNCTARRENCRNLDRLCRNGSGEACRRAASCWTAVNGDCGT